MAKKKNKLTPSIRKLHRALSLANAAGFVLDGAVTRDAKRAEHWIRRGMGNSVMTGAILVGMNVDAPSPEEVVAVPYGGGLYQRRDAVAAVQETGLKLPLIVRLEGNNVAAGRETLGASGLAITGAEDLADAAKKAVASV